MDQNQKEQFIENLEMLIKQNQEQIEKEKEEWLKEWLSGRVCAYQICKEMAERML